MLEITWKSVFVRTKFSPKNLTQIFFHNKMQHFFIIRRNKEETENPDFLGAIFDINQGDTFDGNIEGVFDPDTFCRARPGKSNVCLKSPTRNHQKEENI